MKNGRQMGNVPAAEKNMAYVILKSFVKNAWKKIIHITVNTIFKTILRTIAMNKVIIIGGGIAGLSAGIYAQKCGFNATILESHNIIGGNCTAWKRKGYLFEGGMHWLAGSGKNEALNKIWRYLGALDDSVLIHKSEPFMEYNYEGTPIRFYRDVEKTEQHLLELSPADAKEIKAMCDNIRKVKNLSMPVTDLCGVKVTKKNRISVSFLFSAISAIRLMNRFSKVTKEQYLRNFKHEGLRGLLSDFISDESGVVPLFFSMGTFARGDGGFPDGGSLPFAGRMAKTFTDLGGELLLNTRADRVIIENGKTTGIIAGDKQMSADAVIVASDTMAISTLFDVPLKSPWLDKMQAVTKPTMCTFISLGIDADLRKYPHNYVFKLNKQLKIPAQAYNYLSVNNYANDRNYSPEGKTAMTIILNGDTYDFWKKARENGTYKEEKQNIAEEIAAAITAEIPEAYGKIEVIDVATPLTYERYCGNWKGSWMTEMGPGMEMKNYPAVIKGLSGVYFAGHRMMPPGGFPPAVMSGRIAVQYLCRDTDKIFISEE